MVASGNGHTAFMRFLLDEGVDPGIANNSGEEGKGREGAPSRAVVVQASRMYTRGRRKGYTPPCRSA